MTRALRFSGLAAIMALTGQVAEGQDLLVQARPGEVLMGPIPIQQTVLGIPLALRASGFFTLKSVADRLQIDARILGDLSDLQTQMPKLVDTIPLPTDNCSHFGSENFVVKIWSKEISISGPVAALKLKGDVDDWECAKNPIPCTRLEGFQLVFFDCNPPVKTQLVNQPFEATLPFTLETDSRMIFVRLGIPSVDLGGQLGGVFSGILRIGGVDINGKIKDALDGAIKVDSLRISIPEDLRSLNAVITKSEFVSNSGALAATVQMSASLNGKALSDLLRALVRAPEGERPHDTPKADNQSAAEGRFSRNHPATSLAFPYGGNTG